MYFQYLGFSDEVVFTPREKLVPGIKPCLSYSQMQKQVCPMFYSLSTLFQGDAWTHALVWFKHNQW